MFYSLCIRTIVALALLQVNDIAAQTPNKNEAVTVHRDIEFARVDGHALKLDVYVPKDVKNPPLVVWIHGGGWRAGSKNRPSIREATRHGFALASVSYRFTDTAIFPAQIHDCKAAVRWLRANQEKYGCDADWIAVAGESAGGHLALMVGVSNGVKELEGSVGNNLKQSSAVQAIVDYYGPSDFVLRGQTQPDRAYTQKSGSFALLGGEGTTRLDPKVEAFASPTTYITKDDPPLLALHGDEDNIVLLDQSERMVARYREAGLSAQLLTIKGAKHGGSVFYADDNFDAMMKFLKTSAAKASE